MAKKAKIPKSKPLQPRQFEKEQPERYMTENPVWSFRRIDMTHPRWSIKSCGDIYGKIITKLRDFEGMTWQDIISASGGRSHDTNSHFEDVANLCKEARERILELHMEDEDRLFSLRLTAMERLYGILDGRTFFIIWYDPGHEIYPMSG